MARFPLRILTVLLVPFLFAVAASAGTKESGYHWYVNANGAQGTLVLSTGNGGRITGTLLGRPVDGWLVGRRLVLVRQGPEGRETWGAWLATPESTTGDDRPILAGSYLRHGDDAPLPWFGTPQPTEVIAQASRPVPPPPAAPRTERSADTTSAVDQGQQSSETPEVASSSGRTPPEGTPPGPASTLAPRLASGQPNLAGTWQTPDGPLTIRQEGSRLTFELPDREVAGRLTGPDSVIGGFGPGCCKGHLEQAFAVIKWDNGVRWYRK